MSQFLAFSVICILYTAILNNHYHTYFIQIPRRDFFYGKNGRATCLSFLRSRRIQHPGIDCDKMPDVENANTAWLDLSFVYGSDDDKAM